MGLLEATFGSIWLLVRSGLVLEVMVVVGEMSGYRGGWFDIVGCPNRVIHV